MKKAATIFAALFALSCGQNKQPERETETTIQDTVVQHKAPVNTISEPQDAIAAIRQKVEHINTALLEKKHFEFTCDEKMTVDYFYEDGKIVKISVDFGTVGDVYAKEDYYYHDGKFIFMYEFVEGGPACEGCIKTNEYRNYIKDNKSIKYLKDQKEDTCRTCEFSTASRQYRLLKANTQPQIRSILCPGL